MYGLINIAIRELVLRDHGEARWQEIVARAAPSPADFVGMQTYPDEITYRLVAASSDVLRVPASDLLRAFGRFWATDVAPKHYREIFDLMGRSLAELLPNLHRLHDRITTLMPQLEPPTFAFARQADGALWLRYESQRPGLAPMVIGVLEGFATVFRERVEVTQVAHRDAASGTFDEFRIVTRRLAERDCGTVVPTRV